LSVTFADPPESVAVVTPPAPVKVSVPVGRVPFTVALPATVMFSVTVWPKVAVDAEALTVVVVEAVPTGTLTAAEVILT
jgi:hypothetical protein